MIYENNAQGWRISPAYTKTKTKAPHEVMAEAKDHATACVYAMRGILDLLEADLQPKGAKIGHAIKDRTERDLMALRDRFAELCKNLDKYRDAEELPNVKRPAQYGDAMANFVPCRGPEADRAIAKAKEKPAKADPVPSPAPEPAPALDVLDEVEKQAPGYVGRSKVLELAGVSSATLFRKTVAGEFPKPTQIRLNGKENCQGRIRNAWRKVEVLAWIKDRDEEAQKGKGKGRC